MKPRQRKTQGKSKSRSRRGGSHHHWKFTLQISGLLLLAALAYASVADWFVHHPREWLDNHRAAGPSFLIEPLYSTGNAVGDLTDALGWTGSDAVYEYDEEAPAGEVLFAGEPLRVAPPAPSDIVTLDRGEFKIGWSPSLHHPVWVAYHVPQTASFNNLKRPSFTKDHAVPSAPRPADYSHSGFDSGHMAPNYAIVTRFGPDAQRKTFQMSNIAPQSPTLNRGVWRDLEHRIAQLWTQRYGEIWVIVGAVTPTTTPRQIIPSTSIDIPDLFYQIIIAQEGMDIRALAVLFSQNVPPNTYAARCIVTIDELEELTGLDFFPDLPSFIQTPLEAHRPTRLWPIRFQDVFKLLFPISTQEEE